MGLNGGGGGNGGKFRFPLQPPKQNYSPKRSKIRWVKLGGYNLTLGDNGDWGEKNF